VENIYIPPRRRSLAPCGRLFLSILHLGTEQIRALVVEIQGQNSAVILGYGVRNHPLGTSWEEGGRKVAPLAVVADEALREAEDGAARRTQRGRPLVPDEVVISLPSAVLWGHAYTVGRSRAMPGTPVAQREVESLWERAERLAAEQSAWASSKRSEPLTLFSLTLGTFSLDGHLTSSPVGLKGKALTLTFFALGVPGRALKALQKLAERLELAPPLLVAEPQALAASLGEGDAVAFDVGGWHTTVTVLRAGALAGLGRVALGGLSFSESLKRVFHCPLEEAEVLKRAFAARTLPESDDALVWAALEPAIMAWRQKIEQELARLALEGPLPRMIYVHGAGSYLPGLVEKGLAPLLLNPELFDKAPEVSMLEPSMLPQVVDRTGRLHDRGAIGPLSLARWAALSLTFPTATNARI
jgi:cell division ATPase FtsA